VIDGDVGMGLAAVADAIHKVAMVGRQVGLAARHFLNQLIAWTKNLESAPLAQKHHAVGAIEGIPVFKTFLHIGRPDALLEDELTLVANLSVARIFEHDVLRVGELLVVVEEVFAAHRHDRAGVRVDAQAP
jgi:hypothetical protein